MNLIFLGAPGAGKGTQAGLLSRKLNIPTISTGNILRAAMKDGTPIGKEIESYMQAGHLVPDALIIDIILKRVQEADCSNGYILDGCPRTIAQAEALEAAGIHFDKVLSIEISDQEIIDRMSGRLVCEHCGAPYHAVSMPPRTAGVCDVCRSKLVRRPDDEPETVKARLDIYHEKTEPLKAFYAQRGVLAPVENQPSIEATTAEIEKILGI
ncbi:MAG: adenylate kinase [Ruminococcaceae bacterium]|nr:adenylate kinase [Oscillospiraceae bacterium]